MSVGIPLAFPRLVLWLLAGVLLTGCPAPPARDPFQPDKIYTPTLAGIVESEEFVTGVEAVFTLASGEQLRIDLNTAVRPGEHPQPDLGDLLLYGEDADGVWYVAISGSPPCFLTSRSLAYEEGEFIVFNYGLRLPKADDFDPGSVDNGRWDDPRSAGFCINASGEVTEYRG